MSLQVWLPFNNSISNQGLFECSETGSATYGSGKVTSKCLSCNGTSSYYVKINDPIKSTSTEFSISLWFKLNNVSHTGCLWNGRSTSSSSKNATAIFVANTSLYVDDYTRTTISANLNANVWYHLCVTWKSGGKKITYLNGESISSVTAGSISGKSNTFGTIGRSSDNDSIIAANYLNGFVNDFRIYDNELSVKEVKELAKGLCLHYKLSRGGENLLSSSIGEFTGTNTSTSSYKDFKSWNSIVTPESDSWYTTSFDVKGNVNGSYFYQYLFNNSTGRQCDKTIVYKNGVKLQETTASDGNTGLIPLTTDYQHIVIVRHFNTHATALAKTLLFRIATGSNYTVTIKNVKLEKGDHATSWIPNKYDLLYEQLGYKQDDPTLYSKSLYSGATRNGSDSSRSSTITKTLNSDGSYKYKLSYTGTGSNGWSAIDFPVFTFTDGTTYHFVCKIRCNSSNIAFNLRAARCNNDYATSSVDVTTVKGYSGWITYHVQAVCNTTLSGTASTVGSPRLEFYTSNMSTSGTVYSFDIDIKDCQIYSNSDYQKIYDTEGDCSGYGNNGIINEVLTYSNDTPRYLGSSYFGYTQNVQGNFVSPSTPITISFWAKVSQFDTSGWVVLAGQSTAYYLDADSNSGANWHSSKATVSKYYRDGELVSSSNTMSQFISRDGGWHHYTYVCTLTDWTKITLNGGSLWSSSWRANVNMSDFRIYATELSASDIKALYNTPISIDNKNNLFCGEVVE